MLLSQYGWTFGSISRLFGSLRTFFRHANVKKLSAADNNASSRPDSHVTGLEYQLWPDCDFVLDDYVRHGRSRGWTPCYDAERREYVSVKSSILHEWYIAGHRKLQRAKSVTARICDIKNRNTLYQLGTQGATTRTVPSI